MVHLINESSYRIHTHTANKHRSTEDVMSQDDQSASYTNVSANGMRTD